MKRVIVLALMSGSLAVPAVAIETEQSQPAKVPTANPAGPSSRPGAPRSRPAAPAPRLAARCEGGGQPMRTSRPVIILKEKRESVKRELHGASDVFRGSGIDVVAERNMLEVTMVGTANAYAWALCHSYGGALMHLEQEFEVSTGACAQNVVLTMSTMLQGHLRTDHSGGACLRVASASVQPVGGGPSLALAFAPRCAGGVKGVWPVKEESTSSPVAVPAGRFLLVADFIVEATADHFCKGHGEVDFSPNSPEGTWSWPDPIEKEDPTNYGFHVLVRADTP